MCGIVGVFNLDRSPFPRSYLVKMTKAIAHRGPDDEGYFMEDNIAFGHKRLSILDTSSRGAQPMSSKDGVWTIVFNGCIYNFLDLKQELKSKGHEFVSGTDTEVVVEGLSEYGPSFFERLNGMFAVGAWNRKKENLYLSRDRYGVKPLYYWFTGKTLVFSSEIKAILQHPEYSVSLNLEALNEYFTFQNLFRYQTLFQGIILLPPANTVSLNMLSTGVRHQSWWDYDFSKPDHDLTLEDAEAETKRLLNQAVNRQMISDVPVGSYLSGGMDSGSITAIASKKVERLSTFTCGFDMSEVSGRETNYDERRDAELMANYYKTEHYEQIINAGDLRWSLPKVVYHLEDLRVGMSYPNYYISRLASKFVKVCLQGTGGDELFGGYPWRYYRIFKSIDQKEFFELYYQFWQRLVPDEDWDNLFQNHVYSHIERDKPRKTFENVFLFNNKLSYDTPEQHINNSLYFEIKTFLPSLLLVGDKLSMAHGLEERFPFLDNDLVEFAQKIPVRHKLANLTDMKKMDENEFLKLRHKYMEFDDGKNVLRRAMMDFIPKKIIERKKQGFSAPDESWYRGENAKYIRELLLNSKTVSTDFINRDYIERVVNEHINHHVNHRLLIWSFMCFEWWCRIFLNNRSVY